MDGAGPDTALAFTFEALVIASVLYSLPFAVQPIAAGVRAGRSRRCSKRPPRSARRARARSCASSLPLSIEGIVAGLVLSFAHTLGEFGVVLMVGGNLPGVTRTVSISIYDHVQALEYRAANQTALAAAARFRSRRCRAVYGLLRKPWAVAPLA